MESYNLDRPWERQPCDSEETYIAFQEYLLHPARPRVVPGPRWRVPYEAHAWRARALAYDAWLNAQRLAMAEQTALTMAQRHAELGVRFQALSKRELDKLHRASEATGDVPALKEGTILRYAETGIRIEREAAGVAPPPSEELDLSKLSLEEVRTLHALTRKAQKSPG